MLEEYDIYISEEKLEYFVKYTIISSWILGFIRYLELI